MCRVVCNTGYRTVMVMIRTFTCVSENDTVWRNIVDGEIFQCDHRLCNRDMKLVFCAKESVLFKRLKGGRHAHF